MLKGKIMHGKKVLLISNNGQGFYNFKKELIESLIDCGSEVHFSVPQYERLVDLTAAGAIYHELHVDRRGMNPVKDLGFISQLRRLYKEVKPDIVVLHTIKPNIYGGALASYMGIPYINNITGLGSALQTNNRLAKVLRSMYRFALRKTGGVFFENEGNCDYFRTHFLGNQENYVVVPGSGVNTAHYAPISDEDAISVVADSDTTFSKERKIRFLYIARVMRDKGIEEYLQAAQTVKNKFPNAVFQILGYYDEDCYREQVEKLVSDGVIEYLGVSNDTRIQMAQADCIVLPSYHEGLSNVLLEGASFGLPLITTNIHGCKEAVDEGTTGYLCEPKDAESLVIALEKFLARTPEERRAMGAQGRQKIIDQFDRSLVVGQYIVRIEALIK